MASATRSIALNNPTTPAASTSAAGPIVCMTAARARPSRSGSPAITASASSSNNVPSEFRFRRRRLCRSPPSDRNFGGDPSGQKLDLRVGDRAIFGGKVAHRWSRQVLGRSHREEAASLVRYQRQRAADIDRRVDKVVGFVGSVLVPGDVGTQASCWRASAGRYREGGPSWAIGSCATGMPRPRANVSIAVTCATMLTISTYSPSAIPLASTSLHQLRVNRPGSVTIRSNRFHPVFRQSTQAVMAPGDGIGRRAALRRLQSSQVEACRASSATAIRAWASSQVPARPNRSHARR